MALGIAVALFFRKILLQKSFLWEDFLLQAYPFRNFAAVSLARGELPLWNPHVFGGMPFQADIQSAVFYVPHLLLTPFAADGLLSYYALEVVLIAHFWLAAVGMYYFARELELEPAYSAFSAVAFALSGFMIVHAIHPGFVQQVAWFPLIMLCARRALDRSSTSYALAAGLLAGHAILAGAPQISLYLFVLLFCYAAFTLAATYRSRTPGERLAAVWLPGLIAVVALGVAAVQLVPTLELAPLSQRSEISFGDTQAARLDWRQLITALVPKYFGARGALEQTYWGRGIHGTYWETCFYWGIPALFAATYAVPLAKRSRAVMFLSGMVVLSFMLAVGDQFVLHRLFYEIVPGFSKFRAVARILVLATFAVALLAGFGVRRLVDRSSTDPRAVERALVNGLAVVVVVWIVVQLGIFLPPSGAAGYAEARSIATSETRIALALGAMVFALGFLLTRRVIGGPAAVGAFILLQYADVTRFGFDQNNGEVSGERYFVSMPELQQELVDRLLEEREYDLFRVTARTGELLILDRNHGMFNGLEFVDGYTALRLRRSVPPARDREAALDLLNTRYRLEVDTATGGVAMRASTTHLPRALVVHAATVIEDDSAAAAFLRTDAFDPARTVVLNDPPRSPANRGHPAFAARSDTTLSDARIRLIDRRSGSMTLDVATRRPGILVLSEIHYPGWRATVNGVPEQLFRANISLRAVALPAGSVRVVLIFTAPAFRIGAAISLLTLMVVVGFLSSRTLSRPPPHFQLTRPPPTEPG